MKEFLAVMLITLSVAFTTLKLAGVIDWSWWLVLVPIWIPVAIWVLMITIILIIYGLLLLVAGKE